MHEYGITETVVATVAGQLPDATVTCVHLEIGSLSGVAADSVRFYFPMAAEGTNVEGARLEISEVPARCRCGSCGEEFEPDSPIPLCPCGSADTTVLSGGDMRIMSVEVASAPAREGDQPAPAGDQPAPAGDQAGPAGDQPAPAGDQAGPA